MSDESEQAVSNCEDFQRRLPDLVEARDESLYRDPHLTSCASCRALVVDLEKIAEGSRDLFGHRE